MEKIVKFSDYIIYADESGDHSLNSIDTDYPVFVLAFCIILKEDYLEKIVPSVQRFKFNFWGHDSVILHEREIRKQEGVFSFLRGNPDVRDQFYRELNTLVEKSPLTFIASVIHKDKHKKKYNDPWNPYKVALYFCMEMLHSFLCENSQQGRTIHVVFEKRGNKEDKDLELAFRRIVSNDWQLGKKRMNFSLFDFQSVFVPKLENSTGLQLADMAARPIGLSILKPNQENRAFTIIKPKIHSDGLNAFHRYCRKG